MSSVDFSLDSGMGLCYTGGIMKIDYAAISDRLAKREEFRKFQYDIPHPWEEGYVYWPRDSFHAMYQPGPKDDGFWWPVAKFPESWKGLSPLVLFARLVRNEEKLPHRTACPKCNEIRVLRKSMKGILPEESA